MSSFYFIYFRGEESLGLRNNLFALGRNSNDVEVSLHNHSWPTILFVPVSVDIILNKPGSFPVIVGRSDSTCSPRRDYLKSRSVVRTHRFQRQVTAVRGPFTLLTLLFTPKLDLPLSSSPLSLPAWGYRPSLHQSRWGVWSRSYSSAFKLCPRPTHTPMRSSTSTDLYLNVLEFITDRSHRGTKVYLTWGSVWNWSGTSGRMELIVDSDNPEGRG